jgi:hypothetical protein
MTAPVIPNACPVAAMLIDPMTGVPYKAGGAGAPSVLPVANLNAPLAAALIDPVSGLPYAAT